MTNLSAAGNPFGSVTPPDALKKYGADPGLAIGTLIQYAIWILIAGAGVYALFNLLYAGYDFISAGDDSKKFSGAWSKIWQTILGLAIAAGAFVLAALVGKLIFDDPTFILNPKIPTL